MSINLTLQPDAQASGYLDGPRLLADIGGTFARFALERAPGQIDTIKVLRCADHKDLADAADAYLAQAGRPAVQHASVDIATPVDGDTVRMTNHSWVFSIEETRQKLNLQTLLVVNDFTALAMALPHLEQEHLQQVGGGSARPNGVIGLVGAGTGLGVGGLIPTDGRWIALGSEGGHTAFSPMDEREAAVLQYCWKTWDHVSAERLVSGTGIETIYKALAWYRKQEPAAIDTPEIVRRSLAESDRLCMETVECFCGMLGTVAANIAVTLGALGGIYIGGGVVPRLGDYFARSPFRERFERKGRFSGYMSQIPTYVITAPYPALVGAATILAERLGKGSMLILERIRKIAPTLSPAEEKVANIVLSNPRSVINEPISAIARRAEVSQPTVIRFCRTLGCQGLADFKLKLASSVTATVPVAHSQVHAGDSPVDAGAKVIDNTISAMLSARDNLNAELLTRVVDTLCRASRVDFYGFGSCGLVAEDARQKFFRLGMPASAYTDPQLQEVAASMLRPGDVAVVISHSGRLRHLAPAVEAAAAAGATIIALAPANSPLARRADIALPVQHDGEGASHIPMVSRIILLLLIDMLAVGVSISRSSLFAELQRQAKRGILAHTMPAGQVAEEGSSSASADSAPPTPARPVAFAHADPVGAASCM